MPQLDFRKPRLFVDAPLAAGASVVLDRDQANYLGNVLRLSSGADVLAFNGRDGEWRAQIAGRKRPETLTVVARTRPQDSLGDVAYVFALLKSGSVQIFLNAPEAAAAEYPSFKDRPIGGTLTLFIEVERVRAGRRRGQLRVHSPEERVRRQRRFRENPGESARACAEREAFEETGLRGALTDLRYTHRYRGKKGQFEEHAFLLSADGSAPALSDEHVSFRWTSPADARAAVHWTAHRHALELALEKFG